MKKLTTIILTAGICLAGLRQANATAQLRISDGTVAGTVVVVDDGPGDSANTTPGQITYVGPVGPNWIINVTTGSAYPATGTPSTPSMDVGTVNISSGAGALTIDFSQDGFTAGGAADMAIGGTTVGSLSYQVWSDPNNALFGKTSLIGTVGPLTPSSSGGGVNGEITGTVAPVTPYSLTMEAVIQHPAGGNSGFDAQILITPPSCNCTLSFNSPSAITNCAGDVIPAATAYQICNGISNNVQVTVVGAVTNGTCPMIITRTNAAVDNCNDVLTFVQTIVVNCKGSICGHIFADCDGSGDLSAGDVGLSKVSVSLINSANKVVATQTTDANGGYCFLNLAGGNYTVSVTPPTGYSQTAASTSYHWKDNYGRICWGENDGYIHCLSSGTECWWDKTGCSHWKDNYGRDCWKDKYGSSHCQPCSYQSCNAQTYNDKITVCLTNCTALTDVDFAYTGNKPCLSVSVSCPSYVKCGQTCTFTCTVQNTGNACFTGGTICHQIGNCGGWGGWNNCNTYNTTCPPLSPGQKCTITQKCTFNSWNCGSIGCQSTVNCNNNHAGNCSGQSTCYTQCGW